MAPSPSVGWQVTLCDFVWQVRLSSREMGFSRVTRAFKKIINFCDLRLICRLLCSARADPLSLLEINTSKVNL